jgi:general secretion pathway protein K
MRRNIPQRERGAALLAVLLLVAVMGALAATALERLRLSVSLAGNVAALDQARSFAVGIESLLTLGVDDLLAASPDRTTLAGGWNGQSRTIPLPGGGLAEARLRDGGNCFNLNSLVDGVPPNPLTPRPAGINQFTALLRILEVPEGPARTIAESAGDWIDSDGNRSRQGAEDADYGGAGQGYLTGATLFADVSELRTVAGVTPEIYEAVRPWLCALPSSELSPINVNTLTVEQAPLLRCSRPTRSGWSGPGGRSRSGRAPAGAVSTSSTLPPSLGNPLLPLDVQLQPQLRTRWFKLDLQVALAGAELTETALVDARIAPARVVTRRWGNED